MLVGECHQCGLCCCMEEGGRTVRCANLVVERGSVGVPGATRCSAYAERYNGMPIPLVDVSTGFLSRWSQCGKDSPEEVQVILARGIGRGCSLAVREVSW